MTTSIAGTAARQTRLAAALRDARSFSVRLAASLGPEDQVVQSMPDVSPTKWHLAHVTWFFETFVLRAAPGANYEPRRPEYRYLFNSYYNEVGDQFPRPRRGLLTRPTVAEVLEYRAAVDDAMAALLERGDLEDELLDVIEIGVHHEQQHQELLLMDIKHVLSCNPLWPAYDAGLPAPAPGPAAAFAWLERDGGLAEIGHDGPGFAYDNETPRHRVVVEPHRLANRPVTNREYLEFVADGGYRRAGPWLADGWAAVNEHGWQAPLYWVRRGEEWHEFTLAGLRPLDLDAPVCHVSYFEADAYAAWAGARLPRETEWEIAARDVPLTGNFVDDGVLQPAAATAAPSDRVLLQAWGDVWEWTASPYSPYPGFQAPDGALGEYNGKFMCGQYVLRGGSCVTSRSHVRPTYRNFFYPHQRWAFSGIRLADDTGPAAD